jgi:hypothetical protein
MGRRRPTALPRTDPMNWGADAIFTLNDRKLTLASYYKMPAPQTRYENCVAHNGSLIPIPGRDIEVQAWYQGGFPWWISPTPRIRSRSRTLIADPSTVPNALGGMWSTYWYNGYIYGSEIARGVRRVQAGSEQIFTQREIDAANQVHFDELNVQNQPQDCLAREFHCGARLH